MAVGWGSMLFAGHALALTPPSYSESITSFPGGMTTSNIAGAIGGSQCFTGSTPCGNGYSYTAEAEAAGGGSAHVDLSATGLAGIFSAQVQARVTYGIFLAGAPGVSVPITISSYIQATASNTGVPARSVEITSAASLTVNGPGVMYDKGCVAYPYPGVPGGCTEALNAAIGTPVANASTSGPILLMSGTEYMVVLTASAMSQEFGTAEAYADPVFTVDPAFAASFRLLGVPGDGPDGAAAPEPATWSLTILGFGMIGGAIRRRRSAIASTPPPVPILSSGLPRSA